MGLASQYEADQDIDPERIQRSMKYRRDVAWQVVEKVIRSVPLSSGVELPNVENPSLPLWVTWYDSQEFRNIARQFVILLTQKPTRERNRCLKNAGCVEPLIDAALQKNLESVNWDFWEPQYFEGLLGQIRNQEDLNGFLEVTKPAGISSRGITLYSPDLVRHYLKNIREILKCDKTLESLSNGRRVRGVSRRAPCFREEFPKSAVALKLTWTRTDKTVGIAKTSGSDLKQIFATGDWLSETEEPEVVQAAEIGSENIFTMQSRDLDEERKKYVLTGMHIVTKEIPDWLWISLWWSPSPDNDFGADRPEQIRGNKPWNSYKMCVTGSFVDSDQQPWIHYEADAGTQSLAEVLKVQKGVAGDYGWCSNMFVEVTPGHARTNCIGCHQHAGFDVDPTDFPEDYPHFDRAQRQTYFPGDYLYSFNAEPDNFVESLQTVARQAGLRF